MTQFLTKQRGITTQFLTKPRGIDAFPTVNANAGIPENLRNALYSECWGVIFVG